MPVQEVAVGGVERRFRGWQREYQPTLAGIDGTKLQDVPKKRSIRFGVPAIEKYVGTLDHDVSVPTSRARVTKPGARSS
jgi:hypothetical protein